jgi:hypothetical protein
MAVRAGYASPGLRWGLVLEDCEKAYAEFSLRPDSDPLLGIPEWFQEGEMMVTAIVTFPETDRENGVGFKPLTSPLNEDNIDHPTDRWVTLCTKALGRALKRAGYPDDMDDLRAVSAWRKRQVELRAIASGLLQVHLEQAPVEQALTQAGRATPDEDDHAELAEQDFDEGDALIDAEPDAAPGRDSRAELRETVNALQKLGRSAELTAWCRERSWKITKPATEGQARQIIEAGKAMLAGGVPEAPPAVDVAEAPERPPVAPAEPEGADLGEMRAELLEAAQGLTGPDLGDFLVFLHSLGIADVDGITSVAADKIDEVAGWLEQA